MKIIATLASNMAFFCMFLMIWEPFVGFFLFCSALTTAFFAWGEVMNQPKVRVTRYAKFPPR